MAKQNGARLRINPDFNLMVTPLPEEDRIVQENSIVAQGKSFPIRVWGDVLLVDYEAYAFCRARKIEIVFEQLQLKNREEAIAWIAKHQLARTDLTEEMQKYLIGKRCNSEKVLGTMESATHREAARQKDNPEGFELPPAVYESTATRTWEKIGSEYHISVATVRKYGIYAQMLDQLHGWEPAFVKMILQGNFRVSHENLVEITTLKREEVNRLSKYFFNGNEPHPSYMKFKSLHYDDKPRATKVAPPAGSIKEIPQYDPDAEVASLGLTVPSWTDSVKRVQRNTDFAKISERARWRLVYELDRLLYCVEDMLAVLKEDNNG